MLPDLPDTSIADTSTEELNSSMDVSTSQPSESPDTKRKTRDKRHSAPPAEEPESKIEDVPDQEEVEEVESKTVSISCYSYMKVRVYLCNLIFFPAP